MKCLHRTTSGLAHGQRVAFVTRLAVVVAIAATVSCDEPSRPSGPPSSSARALEPPRPRAGKSTPRDGSTAGPSVSSSAPTSSHGISTKPHVRPIDVSGLDVDGATALWLERIGVAKDCETLVHLLWQLHIWTFDQLGQIVSAPGGACLAGLRQAQHLLHKSRMLNDRWTRAAIRHTEGVSYAEAERCREDGGPLADRLEPEVWRAARRMVAASVPLLARCPRQGSQLQGLIQKEMVDSQSRRTSRLLRWQKRDKAKAKRLFAAIRRNDLKQLRTMIRQGHALDAITTRHVTPLHHAAALGRTKAAALLIRAGADLQAKTTSDATPLWFAAAGGHASTARLLVRKGADLQVRDDGGGTVLHAAVFSGNGAVVSYLLNKRQGGLIEARDNKDRTPLTLAVIQGHRGVIEILLEAGADLHVRGRTFTLLHLAADSGRLQIVRLLLEKGLSPTARSGDGKTPSDMALDQGHTKVAGYLDAQATLREENVPTRSPLSKDSAP